MKPGTSWPSVSKFALRTAVNSSDGSTESWARVMASANAVATSMMPITARGAHRRPPMV